MNTHAQRPIDLSPILQRRLASILLFAVLAALILGANAIATSARAGEVPGCRKAWNTLAAADALPATLTLVRQDCPVLYRKKWLISPNGREHHGEVAGCRSAWDELVAKRVLVDAYFLVGHNCPVLKRQG